MAQYLRLILPAALLLLTACGELAKEEFPCLVNNGSYDTYNEAFVFAPAGDGDSVLARAREAEQQCRNEG